MAILAFVSGFAFTACQDTSTGCSLDSDCPSGEYCTFFGSCYSPLIDLSTGPSRPDLSQSGG